MFDPKKFRLFVQALNVWIYYDKVVLPDGKVVSVNPGKYMKIDRTSDGKTVIRFEDSVEELGLKPDYDYNQPYCIIDSVGGIVVKTVSMRCKHSIGWIDKKGNPVPNVLYYGKTKAAEFAGFKDFYPVSFSYLDRNETLAAGAGLGALLGLASYTTTKKPKLAAGIGLGALAVGSAAALLLGE